jgi:hypothetical protein
MLEPATDPLFHMFIEPEQRVLEFGKMTQFFQSISFSEMEILYLPRARDLISRLNVRGKQQTEVIIDKRWGLVHPHEKCTNIIYSIFLKSDFVPST